MIRFENVTKIHPGRDGAPVRAVDDVSFEVATGEALCLIGRSGCGKTTTIKLVNRLLEPTSGTVVVGSRPVAEVDVLRLRRGIGYVIQSGGLFPHMTVGRNVALPCELERWPSDKSAERVRELLELVGLAPDRFVDRYPGELSGGERQRVGVARALALDPDYLLMDEPFGALDPITRRELRAEFRRLREELHKTVLFVTHDMQEAFDVGDRVALMDAGRIVQIGDEADFRMHPASTFVADFLAEHLGVASC